MEPRPDEIAGHRFSLKLFGVHPGEVRCSLLEIGAALDHTRTSLSREILECRAVEKSLEVTSRRMEESREQLIAAQAKLGGYQNQQRKIERELLAAVELNEQTAETARAQAEEMVAAAQQTAKATMQAAWAAALDALRSTRTVAETAIQVADLGVLACPVGPRVEGDRQGDSTSQRAYPTRQTIQQHLAVLIARFEELALEPTGAFCHREASQTDGGEGAATTTDPDEMDDPVCALLDHFLRQLKEMRAV